MSQAGGASRANTLAELECHESLLLPRLLLVPFHLGLLCWYIFRTAPYVCWIVTIQYVDTCLYHVKCTGSSFNFELGFCNSAVSKPVRLTAGNICYVPIFLYSGSEPTIFDCGLKCRKSTVCILRLKP